MQNDHFNFNNNVRPAPPSLVRSGQCSVSKLLFQILVNRLSSRRRFVKMHSSDSGRVVE